ncbi:hypothetical protein MSG28_002941 [Choristoneura fumiferana]|uniref:Uncharacterized protein n=1 Tax=Choristoneura fumiferana TaxID=7141 RepID=A0ACC0JK93_CHOFU|nr:hypothetical protein MSG28_002941 [Choristoneura fumiferana]
MEFITYILCAAVFVQTSAAPLEASYPHHNNQFDLPEIARNGFEMTLEASIDKQFKEKLQTQSSWDVILETKDNAKFCASQDVEGMHICITPKIEKPCDDPATTTFKLRIKAVVNTDDEELLLQVYLNGSHQLEEITTFEQFKHVTVGGVIGDIQKLHFDFSEQAKAG